jgi:hypothetical protein
MSEDLLLLRLLAPRVFRGVRFFFWMMFWLTIAVCLLGVVAGLLAPDRDAPAKRTQQTHHAVPSR